MLLQDGAKTDAEIGPMRTRTGCSLYRKYNFGSVGTDAELP